jgi:hypothetical protein
MPLYLQEAQFYLRYRNHRHYWFMKSKKLGCGYIIFSDPHLKKWRN